VARRPHRLPEDRNAEQLPLGTKRTEPGSVANSAQISNIDE